MLAFAACHVVAPAVLFNCGVTPGAFLRVGRNPVGRLGIILALLKPHLDESTRRWLVVIQCAPEAEVMLATALYRRYDAV